MELTTISPERLRNARLRSGMSQDDALVALRNEGYAVSKAAISKWERDISEPSSGALPYLAHIYNVSLEYLYGADVDEHELMLAAAHRDLDQALQRIASLNARKALVA